MTIKWWQFVSMLGVIAPPAMMMASIMASGIGIDWPTFLVGTVFFLACLGWLVAANLYEKGEI